MKNDSLGDRMKRYEASYKHKIVQKVPLMIRVDGKAFHTVTKRANKPFDTNIINAMIFAAGKTALQMQGFKAAYVQSDEATFLLTDYDEHETQGWFGYDQQKIVSITASYMSTFFNMYFRLPHVIGTLTGEYDFTNPPVFDARVFSVPKEDVVNAFLWRAKDWKRNSLQMFCQSLFSHKELHGKNQADMHEMLYKVGKNWTTDLSPVEKNGTFIIRKSDGLVISLSNIPPDYTSISDIMCDFI